MRNSVQEQKKPTNLLKRAENQISGAEEKHKDECDETKVLRFVSRLNSSYL